MPVRMLLHVLLCLALIANGTGAAWARTAHGCCDGMRAHAMPINATPVAATQAPCHDIPAMTHAADAMPGHDARGHDGHTPAPHPSTPHGMPGACDGSCACLAHAAGALPPSTPLAAARFARDRLAVPPARGHAPPVLPHPLRPPIAA